MGPRLRGRHSDGYTVPTRIIGLGIASHISYQSREEEGTQVPLRTLDRRWGSCGDFAVFFVEAVRSLGFGGRIVSGYLFNPDGTVTGSTDDGSTHAWAEVFVPGAGWITFDPTNRSMGGANLIPVAVTRDIAHAVPVLTLRDIAGQLDQMGERPVRGGRKWQPSSVKALMDEAFRFGLLRD